MNLVRKLRKHGLLLWLLVITIGLRGLIAPGFMLDTHGDGPFGLSIVFCEGLNGGTWPLSEVSATTDHHQHHGTDSTPETTSGMVGHTCALWSTTSLYMESLLATSEHLFRADSDIYVLPGAVLSAPVHVRQPQQPRAPPVTPLIV